MGSVGLKVLKLITGDEIIGGIRDGSDEQSADENYTLDNLLFITNPMKIVADYDPEQKVHALYLIDWVPAIRDVTLPIDKNKVITIGTPNQDLEQHYVDIVLAGRLLEQLSKSEDDIEHSDDDSDDGQSLDSKTKKLKDKLKKHKFDDDDIQ